MKKILLSTAVIATVAMAGGEFSSFENSDTTLSEIEALKARIVTLENEKSKGGDADLAKKVKKLTKKIKKLDKTLKKVRAHDAYDNIKFSMDFRSTVDNINYKYNDYKYKKQDWSGTEAKNDSLFTSRVMLNMKSKPTDNLSFQGQIAAYYTWGTHLFHHDDAPFKSWSGSSKASDTLFRVRRAYFVYNDSDQPYAFSIGRRPSSDGFLANHRENNPEPASPLAHITNMEVDAAMIKLKTGDFVPGSFIKFVYGRAHAGGIESLYDGAGYKPYAQEEGDVDENVDFFVTVASLYNDGQYNLMGQHAIIFDTKGARTGEPLGKPLADKTGKNKSLDAGTAHLTALSLQVDGVGEEISDFLDNTTLFASVARSLYDPDSGHQLLGSDEERRGYSYWVGATIPDMITDDGKFGIEYNYGTQFWTPMTWAEDTAIGSKLAVRGSAIEAYWNFNLMGEKNLPAQIRYTHAQHDYTPNIKCTGWVKPVDVDIEADDIRLSVSYRY
jgi:predicted fused transcriptional regulator/phosphomethylpyrimidine kinase